MRSVAMRASFCCTSWNCASGVPNWLPLLHVRQRLGERARGHAAGRGGHRGPQPVERGEAEPVAAALRRRAARRRGPGSRRRRSRPADAAALSTCAPREPEPRGVGRHQKAADPLRALGPGRWRRTRRRDRRSRRWRSASSRRRGRTPIPRAARWWRCPPTSDPAPGSVIAKAVITLPSAIGPSQRSFCAGDPPSRIGVVPSPWRANTASASGDASPSASRIRQQARRSRSRIGWSQPPAPSSPSSARASLRAAASSAGSGRRAISPAAKAPARSASVGVTRLEEGADQLACRAWPTRTSARAWRGRPRRPRGSWGAACSRPATWASHSIAATRSIAASSLSACLVTPSAADGPRASRAATSVASAISRSPGTTRL